MFADAGASGGRLVGDYIAKAVQTIRAEIRLPDSGAISLMSFYFFSGTDDHLYFYDIDQLPTSPGWHEISASLKSGDWYWEDESAANYGPPTDAVLRDVTEVGLFVYPAFSGKATQMGLDNFALLGDVDIDVEQSLLSLAKRLYAPGETISVSFDYPAGNKKDWIGLYKKGAEAPATPAIHWLYTDGTKLGTTWPGTGTVDFTGGLPTAGLYEARLFANDSYELLAKAEFEVWNPPSLTPAKPSFAPGEPIRLAFTNPGATAMDWIGLYKEVAEAPATPSILWLYTDGTKLGQTALEEGTIEFAGGLPEPGRYLMRLFASDGYELLAKAAFSIGGDAPPTISITRDSDGTITVTFEGRLQTAPTVNGPWQDADATSPLTLNPDQAVQFGRATR